MRPSRLRAAAVVAVSATALILGGCTSSGPEQVVGAMEAKADDGADLGGQFLDWTGANTAVWAFNAALNDIFGIGSSQAKSLAEIQNQLTQIQQQLDKFQSQLTELQGTVNGIAISTSELPSIAQKNSLADLYLGQNSGISLANNEVFEAISAPLCDKEASPATLPCSDTKGTLLPLTDSSTTAMPPELVGKQLGEVQDIVCGGASDSCTSSLTSMMTFVKDIVADPGYQSQIYEGYQAALLDAVSQGANLTATQLDAYNNNVLYAAVAATQLMQSTYNLIYAAVWTSCYVYPEGPGTNPCGGSSIPNVSTSDDSLFNSLVLPTAGFNNSYDFDTNMGAVNTQFQTWFASLQELTIKAFITDNYAGPAPLTIGGFDTQSAKSFNFGPQGLPGGAWTDWCNFYVYGGIVPEGSADLSQTGSWDGTNLSSVCYTSDSSGTSVGLPSGAAVTPNTYSQLVPTAPVDTSWCFSPGVGVVYAASAQPSSSSGTSSAPNMLTGALTCEAGLSRDTSQPYMPSESNTGQLPQPGNPKWVVATTQYQYHHGDGYLYLDWPYGGAQESFSWLQMGAGSMPGKFQSCSGSGCSWLTSPGPPGQTSIEMKGVPYWDSTGYSPDVDSAMWIPFQLNLPNGYIGLFYEVGFSNLNEGGGGENEWLLSFGCNEQDTMCGGSGTLNNEGQLSLCIAGYLVSQGNAGTGNQNQVQVTLEGPSSCSVPGVPWVDSSHTNWMPST